MPINDPQWDHYHFEVMHVGSNTWRTYTRWSQADRVSECDRYAQQVLSLNGAYKAVRVSKVTSQDLAQPMSCHVRPGFTVPDWREHGGFV